MRSGKPWPVAWVGVRRATPLFWQIFATNALLLAVATAVLAFTPLTISFPVALTEVVVLVCGLGAMLLVNAALLRRAMRPLRQLGTTMRRIDPLHPGHRVAIDRADPEVEALSDTFNAHARPARGRAARERSARARGPGAASAAGSRASSTTRSGRA